MPVGRLPGREGAWPVLWLLCGPGLYCGRLCKCSEFPFWLASRQDRTHVHAPELAHAAQCHQTCVRPEAQPQVGGGVAGGPRGVGRTVPTAPSLPRPPGRRQEVWWPSPWGSDEQGALEAGAAQGRGLRTRLQDSWELCPVSKELGGSGVRGRACKRWSAGTGGTGQARTALRPEGGRGPGGGPESPQGKWGGRCSPWGAQACTLETAGNAHSWAQRSPMGPEPSGANRPSGALAQAHCSREAVPSRLNVSRKEGLCPGPSWVGVRRGRGPEGGKEAGRGQPGGLRAGPEGPSAWTLHPACPGAG